ncbi:hypothetical protein DM02DRAFT_534656 [Periconia macrospinosa]|uniref:Chitin-binding type-4 domain-containing protein n=1 Tax=Periconia macrospinosa TaxID=97972 RepID=A0A2V1DF12_9PLEO|nr:hypothetical protein DM02DRAFT_534656 [Periconia macrospinosa]
MISSLSTILLLAPAVLGHGIITKPSPRPVGPAYTAACGKAITTAVNQDNTSYVEQLTKIATSAADYDASKCQLFLCKGLQYEDNTAGVQTYTAGQVVPISVSMRIPHLGSANVTIVDTRTDTVVGDLLKNWPEGYSPGKKEEDIPIEQRQFNITIPEGLEETCGEAGNCVIQWWWLYDARPIIVETFESCIDFKIASNATKAYRFKA